MNKQKRGATSYYKKVYGFFDILEDRVRGKLSRHPNLYALISGIGSVFFFHGVWHIADVIGGYSDASPWLGITTLILSIVILMITGTFSFHFVSDQAIISGITREKKLIEKTEREVKNEQVSLRQIKSELDDIETQLLPRKKKS